ncbi:MAG: ParB/RepB/Spo0J family partition protein [Chloroflexota bacterium]|nr:ParB/RepB/Spo0J family partition protein [Chloroflexota bacterium]
MASKRRRGLGKGLEALIPSGGSVPGLKKVNIDAIVPNPFQARSVFDEGALRELAASIKEVGLIQPLLVQEVTGREDASEPKRYQLIAGERRWRAARLAGLQHVDVMVKDATPQEMLELALVENIQRADLNPLEEAQAYSQLAEEFDLTHERIAERVGRSRASVTNTLRLLQLPEEVKEALLANRLSEGHARALLMLDSKEDRLQALQQVLERNLSVRQTEELARRVHSPKESKPKERTRSPETVALEGEFRDALGTKVRLYRTSKGGRLVIHFYSEEELQALYERIVEGEV